MCAAVLTRSLPQVLRAIMGDRGEIVKLWFADSVAQDNLIAQLHEVKTRLQDAGLPPAQAIYGDSCCCSGQPGCDCSQMAVAKALGLKRVRGLRDMWVQCSPAVARAQLNLDVMHAEKRLAPGLDKESELYKPFIEALASAVLVPVSSSLAAVKAALREHSSAVQFMNEHSLNQYAISEGKHHGVLQRVAPPPADMRKKCVR